MLPFFVFALLVTAALAFPVDSLEGVEEETPPEPETDPEGETPSTGEEPLLPEPPATNSIIISDQPTVQGTEGADTVSLSLTDLDQEQTDVLPTQLIETGGGDDVLDLVFPNNPEPDDPATATIFDSATIDGGDGSTGAKATTFSTVPVWTMPACVAGLATTRSPVSDMTKAARVIQFGSTVGRATTTSPIL